MRCKDGQKQRTVVFRDRTLHHFLVESLAVGLNPNRKAFFLMARKNSPPQHAFEPLPHKGRLQSRRKRFIVGANPTPETADHLPIASNKEFIKVPADSPGKLGIRFFRG